MTIIFKRIDKAIELKSEKVSVVMIENGPKKAQVKQTVVPDSVMDRINK